ncbi:hypothetical protein BOTBODRAFT_587568 [Botryobasidium botryosum FD-172 SS1]|uniref:Zn(2)-C6 fungal-type domain-containing protein n=1 Tax=Botryobasidium botryosum (strain FD-172 SS1) TaxID=930990 RepID=A0A067LXQ1_BOTB1|nr:hypothetical protein BOTBODRAFT_587568 [Botryobasidium botryosum FD-172 SS1]
MGPPLERGAACLLCRRRKQRCDSVKPVCGACGRARGPIQCIYTASRRERLEQRILELESHIGAIKSTHQEIILTLPSTSAEALDMRSSCSSSLQPYSYNIESHDQEPGSMVLPKSLNRTHVPQSALPAVALSLEDPGLHRWRTHREISPEIRNYLICLFVQFRWRHPLELDVPKLLASLALPSSHPNAPNPAFVNAVLLNGALCAGEPFRQFQPVLINRIRKDLQRSLANADRLFDCVKAMAFLGRYCSGRCRYFEDHYYTSAAMSLAIACGLHTIDSLDLKAQSSTSLLDPAQDLAELGDRISTFWMLFGADRIASILVGAIPRGPADEEITTIWPCPAEYYKNGRAFLQQYGTVNSLYDFEPGPNWSLHHNPASLRIKGYAVHYHAYHAACLLAESNIRLQMVALAKNFYSRPESPAI